MSTTDWHLHSSLLTRSKRHVLSNVSRVASRDSGRTVATVQDLFVALCEDESVYVMFKSMKGTSYHITCFAQDDQTPDRCNVLVYEQIDILSKMQHPRRSKSLSKNSLNGRASPTSQSVSHAARDSSPTLSRLGVSSESSGPIVSTALGQQPASNGRSSIEKSRVKLFDRGLVLRKRRGEKYQRGKQSSSTKRGGYTINSKEITPFRIVTTQPMIRNF